MSRIEMKSTTNMFVLAIFAAVWQRAREITIKTAVFCSVSGVHLYWRQRFCVPHDDSRQSRKQLTRQNCESCVFVFPLTSSKVQQQVYNDKYS